MVHTFFSTQCVFFRGKNLKNPSPSSTNNLKQKRQSAVVTGLGSGDDGIAGFIFVSQASEAVIQMVQNNISKNVVLNAYQRLPPTKSQK